MSNIAQLPVSTRAMNLAYWLTQNARRFPDRPALVWREHQWSWREFDARVSAFAAVLANAGVGPGTPVLVHSKNSNEMMESMFAVFRLGAVWVPTNFRLTPPEVVYMAQTAHATFFLCQADFPDHAAAVQAARPGLQLMWLSGDAPAPDGAPQIRTLLELASGTPVPNAPVDRDTACWLFFTSGTTGRSKAAVLTHGQMGFVITNHLCDLMPATTCEDGGLVVAPLSHGAGVHQMNLVARGGLTVLLPNEKLDVDDVWRLVERHRLTSLFTVPTILKMLVEHPAVAAHDHTSLRYVIYAGAPMYRTDQEHALATLGKVLVQYYGLGEVTGNITVLPRDAHGTERIGSCGFERTGMQLAVQDDSGEELPLGQTGEICVIGPAVFPGYFENTEANVKSFRNGWFRTGDIGHMDNEGYVYLTGRSSDMYISGGSNIYPREIEEQILRIDGISEAAVLGVPDPLWGEVGVAVCVTRPGASVSEAQVLDWLKQHMARYKLPKQVHFWDSLPKSGYGKVPKQLVREALQAREGGRGA